MKKNEEFEASIEIVRKECTGRSKMNRICPERLVPDVSTFFDEIVQTDEKKFLRKDGGHLVERYCWLVCFVVDVFTSHDTTEVTDEQYELFLKYMEELRKLRSEVFECYKGTNKSVNEMLDKVCCFWDIIRSSSHWEMFFDHKLFENPTYTYEVLKRMNNDWDELKKVVGDIRDFYMNFTNFMSNQHKLGTNYSNDQMYQIFFDILDGKKKLSNPVKIYRVVGTTYTVVDADASKEVGFGILVPSDTYYQATKHISIAGVKNIRGMGQKDDE